MVPNPGQDAASIPRKHFPKAMAILLLVTAALAVDVHRGWGVVVYRIGTPFTAVERDSLRGLGIDVEEIAWWPALGHDAVEQDSLQAGSLQPDFFDQDEDIAATLLSRGGRVAANISYLTRDPKLQVMVDGDPATAWTWAEVTPESFATFHRNTWGVMLGLGGEFLVREVVFRPLAHRPDHYLENVQILVRDQGEGDYGPYSHFRMVAEVKENTEPDVRVTLDPPVTAGEVWLRIIRHTPKEVGIADIEIYGGGFVRQAYYESEVIEMEDLASWGEIHWGGRRDPEARVEIRTRTGDDPQPEIFWEQRTEHQDRIRFLQGGGDLDFAEYKRQYDLLEEFRKPGEPDRRRTVDVENWSYWSSPYPFETSGVAIASPSPRKFIQLKTEFLSTVMDGGKIDFIQLRASVPPAVAGLVGEIHPTETRLGEVSRFTYFVSPTIRDGDRGFDGIEISTPSGVVSVDSLRIDRIDQEFSWSVNADGLGFEVMLPRRLEPADSGVLVEVVFSATVLREVGNLFAGRVIDTSRPQEVRQRILPGNAAHEIDSDRLSVTTALSNSLLLGWNISPNPFTPNGDGTNDAAKISYKLVRVTSPVRVSIGIYSLSGRLVKQVYEGESPIGEYARFWDGRDSSDMPVAPGLYLCRIAADVRHRETGVGILSVAY